MEHMRQFDWCNTDIESENFLEADEIANSCTEKILKNRFIDPLISTDEDDDERHRPVTDWDEVFAQCEEEGGKNEKHKFYVPGDKPLPPFPKVSTLSSSQHFQMLKVVCAQNPTILESLFFPKPMKMDFSLFEDLKSKYEKEQQEYIQWAATLWTAGHNIRALRPNALVESGYTACCRVRLHAAQGWPRHLHVAAQIPLASTKVDDTCKVTPLEELVKVNMTELPHVQIPDYARRLSILRPCALPEPCNKHPSRFILPGEKSVSILPLQEVHRELCQLAASHGASFVASEAAARTLVERDRAWTLPVSVCQVIGTQGEKISIVALEKEITPQKEPSTTRTYKAFKHLLWQALIPPEEKVRMLNYWNKVDVPEDLPTPVSKPKPAAPATADESDDEADEDNLVIDMDEMDIDKTDTSSNKQVINDDQSDNQSNRQKHDSEIQNGDAGIQNSNAKILDDDAEIENGDAVIQNGEAKIENGVAEKQNGDDKDVNNSSDNNESCDKISSSDNLDVAEEESNLLKMTGDYTCTCDDNTLDRPAPRSYRLWDVQSVKKKEQFKMIVHSSHKARGKSGEVILEPIPEYQPEIGASEIPIDRLRSIAVSLHLRKNASVMLVRIDGVTGEVLCHSVMSSAAFLEKHEALVAEARDSLQVVLAQLQALLPGRYLLRHEPSHGANALLYAAASATTGSFSLTQELQPLSEQDEAITLKPPRRISDALLPIHKHRKTLPCAFTPFQSDVAREQRKPPTRQRTPPRAIRWPKRRAKKRRRN